MIITVLGGSHGAFATAADLALAGHRVRLWRRRPEDLGALAKGITLMADQRQGPARLDKTTADLGEAVRDADVVIAPLPASTHEDLGRRLAGVLTEGQIVLLGAATLGSFVIAREIARAGKPLPLAVAETGTLPYLARKTGPAAVAAPVRAANLPVGVFPASRGKEALARDMTREMGKILDETRGDVQEAVDMTYFMAGEGRRQYGQTTPSELRDKFAMSVRQPLGVCAIITPWNFPMAIPSWKIMPALVCGDTVVFKPATLTPLSALNFVKILEEAGVPRGVVNLVTGGGDAVGTAMTVNDDIRVVSFTGSTDVGRTVSESAAPTFKKVHLEMGGKNVIMVMDDAKLDLAVEGCLWGGFGTSGQRCTAASRVVVHEKVYGELQSKLVTAAEKMRLGPGWEPDTDVGPVINERALEKIHSYTGIGRDEGAKILTGGEVATGNGLENGFYYRPTIFADVEPGMRVAQEEDPWCR